VPSFEPFAGVRYDGAVVDLGDVVAPPYDVIGPAEQAALESRSAYNAVRVELARDEPGADRYELAGRRFDDWLAEGVLVTDVSPGFYVYRMGYHDEAGRPRQTTGVLGALGLADTAEVLPHERTMAKAKDDRLNLLRSTQANLSPIWGLSLGSGLSALCESAASGPPVARCTDDRGVHHRLWRVTEPGLVEAFRSAVGAAPVVIADGHHRYATAHAYRDEQLADAAVATSRPIGPSAGESAVVPSGARSTLDLAGGALGDDPARPGYDFVMAYVVELADDEISVGAIHRVVSGLPAGFDPLEALPGYSPTLVGEPDADVVSRAADAGLPALVSASGAWLLHPVAGSGPDDDTDNTDDTPDAGHLAAALVDWPAHTVTYVNSSEEVVGAVTKSPGQIGFLLRPPTVAQIAATARAGARMPQKTTFFWPKPLTGLVFRRLER
jgi:uncharacterized protein (DUF1015 family)